MSAPSTDVANKGSHREFEANLRNSRNDLLALIERFQHSNEHFNARDTDIANKDGDHESKINGSNCSDHMRADAKRLECLNKCSPAKLFVIRSTSQAPSFLKDPGGSLSGNYRDHRERIAGSTFSPVSRFHSAASAQTQAAYPPPTHR
jgi:hypothetical protein